MIKWWVLSLSLFLVILSVEAIKTLPKPASTVEECKCGKGFLATKYPDGSIMCKGNLHQLDLPCNLVIPPHCNCTEASGVSKENTGTFCEKFNDGIQFKKWPCENEDEWEQFYEEHPDLRP